METRKELLQRFGFILVYGRVPDLALVDAQDHDAAARLSWKLNPGWGGSHIARAPMRTAKQKSVSLHRFVAERAYGPCPSDKHTCEIFNGDPLDCRRANLQWVLKKETAYQKAKASNAKPAVREYPYRVALSNGTTWLIDKAPDGTIVRTQVFD